jgi:hypothetical protein
MRTRQIHRISVLLLLLFFALAPAAMAQLVGLPEYAVLLSGTPDNPVVLNQSPHPILAFALRVRRGDQGFGTQSNLVGLSQLTRGNVGAAGPGIPPGGTSLSLSTQPSPVTTVNGQRADIGNAEATLDSVLFDDGLFVGPDLGHVYESITAMITAEVSVDSLLLSAKTESDFATAWDQIKQIAETPLVPPSGCFAYIAPANVCAFNPTGRALVDPNSPRQFAMQLLSVRDRLGEKAAVAQAASSLAYPKIHKE